MGTGRTIWSLHLLAPYANLVLPSLTPCCSRVGNTWTSRSLGFTKSLSLSSFLFHVRTSRSLGVTTSLSLPSFLFQVRYPYRALLDLKTLLTAHFLHSGAIALKHCLLFFKITGFFLPPLFFSLFVTTCVFPYCYHISRCLCTLWSVEMFQYVSSYIFPFIAKRSSIEWLMMWWHRQYFQLSILPTSADRFGSGSCTRTCFIVSLNKSVTVSFGKEYSLCVSLEEWAVYLLSAVSNLAGEC